jgi:hypothetical protein
LEKAVIKIVIGIRSSIRATGKLTQSKVLKAKVTECPKVNAVTKSSIFFQSFPIYLMVKAIMNKM